MQVSGRGTRASTSPIWVILKRAVDLGIEAMLSGWQTPSTRHSMSEIRFSEGAQCPISSRLLQAIPSPPLSSVS